jgi:hypothetical protein
MILPPTWHFIEEVEGSFVFENSNRTFNVYVDFDETLKVPYVIGYQQQEGDYEMIDTGDDPFTTGAQTKKEALEKAILMMEFINLKLYGDDSGSTQS